MPKVFRVRVKRTQYAYVAVLAENKRQAASVALDAVVNYMMPPYQNVSDEIDDVAEVEMDEI